ncbi:MAG: hypothetical protein AB1730_07545 [Myxococcota bacterium]
MKVLCPQCERLAAFGPFRVDGGVLYVTCARCGVETRVEAPAIGARPPDASTAAPEVAGDAPVGPGLALERAAPPVPVRPPPPARVSLASSPGASNVVMLRTATVEAVERAARSADGNPFEVPEGHCPKCLAVRDGSPSCAQCGVRFDAFQEAHVAPPPWLREAWVALLRDWGTEASHEALRARAQREDALTALGRLYRLRLAVEPNDPIAEKGRADVLRVAAAPMTYRPRSGEGDNNRMKLVLAGAVVLLFLAAVGFFVRVLLTQTP